jgi:hypothetical protein
MRSPSSLRQEFEAGILNDSAHRENQTSLVVRRRAECIISFRIVIGHTLMQVLMQKDPAVRLYARSKNENQRTPVLVSLTRMYKMNLPSI